MHDDEIRLGVIIVFRLSVKCGSLVAIVLDVGPDLPNLYSSKCYCIVYFSCDNILQGSLSRSAIFMEVSSSRLETSLGVAVFYSYPCSLNLQI